VSLKIIETDRDEVARSISLFWFKRIYVGTRFKKLTVAERMAVIAHETGHCEGHHTEWRILLLPIVFWLAKQQEFWADAYAVRKGHGEALYRHLGRNDGGGLFHPSNYHRRQKLVHNKFFE